RSVSDASLFRSTTLPLINQSRQGAGLCAAGEGRRLFGAYIPTTRPQVILFKFNSLGIGLRVTALFPLKNKWQNFRVTLYCIYIQYFM
ncbi:MAG: hypothetical protein O7F73_12255, partial [Gammaproteobacteria bacterium]|nr:hypothetical protein [Gammaproteobacteria bacterium]